MTSNGTDLRGANLRKSTIALVVALASVAFAACSSSTHHPASGAGAAHVTVKHGPHSGLSAVVVVESERPARASVTATSTVGSRHVVTTPMTNESSTRHEIPLIGMRAACHYDLVVSLDDDKGNVETVPGAVFDTDPLPANLPKFDVHSVPTRMAPGAILFNLTYWAPAGEPTAPLSDADYADPARRKDAGWIVGVDEEGQVVWYYASVLTVWDVTATDHGTFIVDVQDAVVREIDMLGNTLHEWGSRLIKDPGTDLQGRKLSTAATQPLDIDSAHHDAHELPNGNLIALSTELLHLPADVGAKLCPEDPARNIAGDVVVEFDRSGKIVHRWSIAKMLDPAQHPGAHMCEVGPAIAPPNWFYQQVESVRDWSHGNAVLVDEKTNTVIVSLRHLDAVIGFRYRDDEHGPSGELLWQLGPHGDMRLEGGGEWQYHQHAPELHDDGTMLLYDNGNLRPGTQTAGGPQPPFSRAVEYKVDFANKTVRQVWEHRDVDPWGTPTYAMFLGDADLTQSGTVLITHGGRADNKGKLAGRIVEVLPGTNGAADEIVFDLTPAHRGSEGWSMYRADKLPSLYFSPEVAG